MENQKAKKNFKTLLIAMSIIISMLLIAGIVLTFVAKSKQSDLNIKQQQQTELNQEYKDIKDKEDYYNSEDYKEDYHKYEENKGQKDDIIIEIQK